MKIDICKKNISCLLPSKKPQKKIKLVHSIYSQDKNTAFCIGDFRRLIFVAIHFHFQKYNVKLKNLWDKFSIN